MLPLRSHMIQEKQGVLGVTPEGSGLGVPLAPLGSFWDLSHPELCCTPCPGAAAAGGALRGLFPQFPGELYQKQRDPRAVTPVLGHLQAWGTCGVPR